jgi:hypothetical protein
VLSLLLEAAMPAVRFFAIQILVASVALTPAFAQKRRKVAEVCAWDIERFCKQLKGLEIKACLAKHEAQLFPSCKDNYRQAMYVKPTF